MADALEEAGVIEKRATEGDGVAQNHETLGKHKRSIHEARGLSRGKLRSDV